MTLRWSAPSQNPQAKYVVVYLTSGTHLTATIVESRECLIKIDDDEVRLNGIIIGHTLYRFYTDKGEEAYYLTLALNSRILDELIKPMQSKGEYGERHIVKKPLESPIPKYDYPSTIQAMGFTRNSLNWQENL